MYVYIDNQFYHKCCNPSSCFVPILVLKSQNHIWEIYSKCTFSSWSRAVVREQFNWSSQYSLQVFLYWFLSFLLGRWIHHHHSFQKPNRTGLQVVIIFICWELGYRKILVNKDDVSSISFAPYQFPSYFFKIKDCLNN